MADQPWHELPPEVVGVLRPALDDVAHEMMEAVATIPAYARPLEGPFGDGLRIGVQEALKHLLEEIEEGGHVDRLDVYRGLGQGEMRAGRSLETLLSAYRVGARVAWRRSVAGRRPVAWRRAGRWRGGGQRGGVAPKTRARRSAP